MISEEQRNQPGGGQQEPGGARQQPGGFVARWAGAVAVLVLVATAVAGITAATRSARIFASLETEVVGSVARALDERLEATARQLVADLASAEEDEDWSGLQDELPRLAATDSSLLRLCISDEEGLVMADSDPQRNGSPLDEPALLPLLRNPELSKQVAFDLGLSANRVARVVGRRVGGGTARARIIFVVGSPYAATKLATSLQAMHTDVARSGWLIVGLGGLVSLVVAVGAVLVAGSSMARRLRVVAWRVAQLGTADRGTHVRLDGPTEMQHVGRELELAAERLAQAAEARQQQEREEALQRSFAAVVRGALEPTTQGGSVSLSLAMPTDVTTAQALVTADRPDGTLAVLLLERLGHELDDALAVVALRGAARALLAGDTSLGPVAVLARLDDLVTHERRTRATVVFVAKHEGGHRASVANAGGAFPVLRQGTGERALIARGDRLGETGSLPRAQVDVDLVPGAMLILTGDTGSPRPLTVTLALS